jgi:hypothetical protein
MLAVQLMQPADRHRQKNQELPGEVENSRTSLPAASRLSGNLN